MTADQDPRTSGEPEPVDLRGGRQATHAGHPLTATTWCVDDQCCQVHHDATEETT